jgi:hypothetical protein
VLADFARGGHQVLLFTCHEHMVNIFRDAEVEVRELPVRGQVAKLPPAPLPVVIESPPVETVKELPRKRRKKTHDEPAPKSVAPPPLPVRTLAPAVVVETDAPWRDPLWQTDSLGAEPFASRWVPPAPKPAVEFDIREEEFLYDDEPVVESPEEPEPLFDGWTGNDEEIFDDDPTPAVQTVPLVSQSAHSQRFTWESPEMWRDDRAA